MLTEIADWVGLLVLPAFIVLDLVFRHRRFDAPRGWRVRALVVSAAIFFFVGKVGEVWGSVAGDVRILDTSGLGAFAGAALGVLAYQLLHYGYHRAAHQWDWLWRAGHQMHHSAESLDAFGANYLHPLDAALFTTWAFVVFYPLLGLSPEAAALASAFLAFNAAFQHANIRTPQWLGYLIQRPESHSVHHAKHRSNYADLPVIDMIFGTFVNPAEMERRSGFYKGASARVGEMLAFRDVSRPRATQAPEPSSVAASAGSST